MKPPPPTVLIVEADPGQAATMADGLHGSFECLLASNGPHALDVMAAQDVQVVICDAAMLMPDGRAVIDVIRARWPATARIHLDAGRARIAADPDDRVLARPCPVESLLGTTRSAARLFQLKRENEALNLQIRCREDAPGGQLARRRAALAELGGFEGVLHGPGSPLGPVIDAARQIACFDVPVAIIGASGTGKRTMAKAMHAVSLRSDRPFCTLDASGLPDSVIAAELFGRRTAGSLRGRAGLLQRADRGTLYLGGLDHLPAGVQVALQRALREGVIAPDGAQEALPVQPRLIFGAARPLADLVDEGRLLPDLAHALGAAQLVLPPLVDRRGDIAALAHHFLFELSGEHGKPVFGLSAEAVASLAAHDWPGNLTELRNQILHMLIFAPGRVLGPELISPAIRQSAPAALATAGDAPCSLRERIEALEARILEETLRRHNWNKSRAAAELGLSRVGLRAKLERYGVTPAGAGEPGE